MVTLVNWSVVDLVADVTEGLGEYLVGTGLSTERLSNNHESMSDNHHFVDLLNLLQEELGALEIGRCAVLFDGVVQNLKTEYSNQPIRSRAAIKNPNCQ